MNYTSKAQVVDDEPPMTRSEAAAFIGCSTRYVDILWRDPARSFPQPFYIGRQLRFPRAEIRAWRERQRAQRPTIATAAAASQDAV